MRREKALAWKKKNKLCPRNSILSVVQTTVSSDALKMTQRSETARLPWQISSFPSLSQLSLVSHRYSPDCPVWVLQSHNLTGSQHLYVLRSIGQHHLRMVPLQGRRPLNEWMNKADAWDCHRKKAQRHLVYWSWLRYRTWKLRNWMEITEHLEAPGFVESCDKGCGNMGPLSQGAALHHDACLVCAQGRIKQSLVSH